MALALLSILNRITSDLFPLGSDAASERWAAVCQPAFERVEAGESVLRGYAATNIAEFFAVATEAFFNRPGDLAEHESALYDELRRFYGQNPADRLSETTR